MPAAAPGAPAVPSRTRTTTAATSCSAPTGSCGSGLGDGGSGGDPENRAQDRSSLLGKMFRLDVRARRRAPSSSRSACATRGATLRPAHRRPLDRRRRPEPDRGGRRTAAAARSRPRQLRLGRLRGATSASRTSRSGLAGWSSRSRSTRTTTAARSPAATSTAGTLSPRSQAATSTATTAAARSGASRLAGGSRESSRCGSKGLVSFGEGLEGELYVVAHGGTIYRLR